MIESYLALAARIRQELADLEHIVQRAERALEGARHNPPDQDYYIWGKNRGSPSCVNQPVEVDKTAFSDKIQPARRSGGTGRRARFRA